MTSELPRRILIVRLGAIGDVCNALVLASALRRANSAVEIGWAVHELSRPLVTGHPAVDRVHVWPRRSGIRAGIRGFVRVAREIRDASYDLAIDLQRIQKSALLARATGARRVLGFDRARTKEVAGLWYDERIPPRDPSAHMVEQYLEFAQVLGIEGARAVFELPRDEAAERWAEAFVARFARAPLVINVGASQPAKRWPADRFAKLAQRASELFEREVVLSGSKSDRATSSAALALATQSARVHDLVGATSLEQLIALERRAALVVTGDSGPMHLACAVGTRVLALFGPGDPRRTGPYGAAHRVLRAPPPCAPCQRRTCNQPRHACMEDLSIERVLETIAELVRDAAD